jgi:hypothetical protein
MPDLAPLPHLRSETADAVFCPLFNAVIAFADEVTSVVFAASCFATKSYGRKLLTMVAGYRKEHFATERSYDRLSKDDLCSQNIRCALTMVIFDKTHLSENITRTV